MTEADPMPEINRRRAIHQSLLRFYGWLPRAVRRRLVRAVMPSYTVGAIAAIERPDGRILLVRQAYRARWGIPGGLCRRGEDPVAAVHREVREEVGLDLELIGEPAVVVDPGPQRVDVVFRARPKAPVVEPVRPRSAEVIEVGWFAPGDLPDLQAETVQALVTLARSRRILTDSPPGGRSVLLEGLVDRWRPDGEAGRYAGT